MARHHVGGVRPLITSHDYLQCADEARICDDPAVLELNRSVLCLLEELGAETAGVDELSQGFHLTVGEKQAEVAGHQRRGAFDHQRHVGLFLPQRVQLPLEASRLHRQKRHGMLHAGGGKRKSDQTDRQIAGRMRRVVGKRRMPLPGPNGRSEADVWAGQEIAMAAPRTAPKGVYRYRSHDEANRDAERWAIDAMVERNLELADRPGDGPKLR
jgi:hypothetical protein